MLRINADLYDVNKHKKLWGLVTDKIRSYFEDLPVPETVETAIERIDDLKGLQYSSGKMGFKVRVPEHYCYACDYAARQLQQVLLKRKDPYAIYKDSDRCQYCPIWQWPETCVSDQGLVKLLGKAVVRQDYDAAVILCRQIRDLSVKTGTRIGYSEG